MNLLFVCYSYYSFNMSGTHFYLTLPSNASSDVFPDNKTTSYRVKLPQTIDLEGNWEVGLYSISYPNTWYTLQKGFDTHVYYGDPTGIFLAAPVDYGIIRPRKIWSKLSMRRCWQPGRWAITLN